MSIKELQKRQTKHSHSISLATLKGLTVTNKGSNGKFCGFLHGLEKG